MQVLLNKPKVSAVIFFYNDEKVFELINVALNQVYHFEYIVVINDGSNLYYHKKFISLFGNFTNIIYEKHSVNRGIPLAMSSGINQVKTEYFYLMSCGDIYENYILKDFNNLNWKNNNPGIIASGVYTKNNNSRIKTLYLQSTKKLILYSHKEYEVLSYKHTNLYYGGGCIINTKLGVATTNYFEDLKWSADFFMYHYTGFKSGVIFTNLVFMCTVLHEYRYCNIKDTENNNKIVTAFITAAYNIDVNFYNYCYKSAILPVYSFIILLNIINSFELRRYVSFYLIYKCILADLGKIIKRFIPHKFKNYLRSIMRI